MKAMKNIASSGGTLDIESMPELLKDLGFDKEFSRYYDVETNQWKGHMAEIFSTDMFGETTFDWNELMRTMTPEKREAFVKSKNYNTWKNSWV